MYESLYFCTSCTMLYLNILICVEYLSRKSCIWCSKGPPHLRTDGSRAPRWCWCWLYWPVDVEMQRNKAHRRLCILSEYILLSIGNVKWLTIYIAYCVNCSFLVPKENEMCSLTAASSFLQLRVWGCQCGNWFSNCCEQTDQTSAHTALLGLDFAALIWAATSWATR